MPTAIKVHAACVVNDAKKNAYAIARGYTLIRIPAHYSQPDLRDEMVEKYLSHILQRHRFNSLQNQGDNIS
jgi:hypothetical protein